LDSPKDTIRPARGELAILLDGGGARAAYQAGFLRALGRMLPELRVEVLVGVSAGAINAVYLASRRGRFGDRTEGLVELWRHVRTADVFDVRPSALALRALRWLLRLGTGGRAPDPRGLLDNTPLRRYLAQVLDSTDGRLPGIAQNIDRGALKALAVVASSYGTGQSITFVQGRDLVDWQRPQRRSRSCEVRLEHVLASAALPFLFPAEQLDDGWYGDGGIRLTTPLSPAIHLGADRVLAISTRYGRNSEEADVAVTSGYPPSAQVAGSLLDAIFLDALDGDALRLERVNELLAGQPRGALRPVDLRVTRPSTDLGVMATRHEQSTPRGLRFLTRGTGTLDTSSNDLLSMILFEPEYVNELLAVGERDALAQRDELLAFLAPEPA
jgi:NTE family protein